MSFIIKIIYQVLGANTQFEERTLQINANNNYDAYLQALQVGSSSQKSIQHNGVKLKWHFINVIDIAQQNMATLPYISNTAIIEPANAQDYLKLMQKKAYSLEQSFL